MGVTSVVWKTKKRVSKIVIKWSIITAIIVAVLITSVYGLQFLYWGRRHSVLYDVKTVTVEKTNNEDIYNITYDVSVSNWFFDIIPHTYKLVDDLCGEPGSYGFKGESEYFKTGLNPTEFSIDVEFDITSVVPDGVSWQGAKPIIREVIGLSQFAAYNKFGDEIQRAELYMSDNLDARIVFVE